MSEMCLNIRDWIYSRSLLWRASEAFPACHIKHDVPLLVNARAGKKTADGNQQKSCDRQAAREVKQA
eukprot:scaffold50116_cov19-Tisochrysis_lutea.AAC.1